MPVFYVMHRYKLGKAILRKVPISCIAVMNYQGTEVGSLNACTPYII